MKKSVQLPLFAGTILSGAIHLSMVAASPAWAQVAQSASDQDDRDQILVTGSRIRRDQADSSAPVASVDSQDLTDRGYVQVGEIINTLPSNLPDYAVAPGTGVASGNGQQFPNLFGIGAGRTLTLVNGRRMVTTSSGLGDRVVDTNIIPVGLLDRVDVVQGGGGAVYGSDAIAGVVNYVLKDDFEGVLVDVQGGVSSRGDYPRFSAGLVMGTNFADDRGNIALDLEYRKTKPLYFEDRPITNPITRSFGNPFNTGPNDGIPSTAGLTDPHFWTFNESGIIFDIPAPSISGIVGQFSDNGAVASFDAGTPPFEGYPCPIPFCEGGDGYPYAKLQALYTGVETFSGTALGHYELSEGARLFGELTFARTEGRDPIGRQAPQQSVLGSGSRGPIPFTRDNPFLTQAVIDDLSILSPGFASGGTLYVSKAYGDLLPNRETTYTNNIYRAVVGLDGAFESLDRYFYYELSFSHAQVKGESRGKFAYTQRLVNATDVVADMNGDPVCAINAVTVVDALCAPVNPFGVGNISEAARDYIVAPDGASYSNEQNDLLVTFGGDLLQLPAGMSAFSLSYQHRRENADNTPFLSNQMGFFFGDIVEPTSGRYHTHEYAAELLLPIVNENMGVPLVENLELEGQYRIVDHSVAGKENVWGAGVRWDVVSGLTLRANRSRNFRAPTLDQLFAPQFSSLQSGIQNPCDSRNLNSGTAVSTRIANCTALFDAHPGWGPLEDFVDPAVNFPVATVTTGGNKDLENEISDTWTFGFVWQPTFVPGRLVLSADRIQIDLQDGLTAFTPTNFVQACFDATPQPADICGTFTLDPATGYVLTATSTTYNAALVEYRGEVISTSYTFPVEWLVGRSMGELTLAFDATINHRLRTTVSGVVTEQADTVAAPGWVGRGVVRYQYGPVTVSYEMNRLAKAKFSDTSSIETTEFPTLESNTRHSVSVLYDLTDDVQLRAGVSNLTDRGPSFSTYIPYGDIIGRQYFAGIRAKL